MPRSSLACLALLLALLLWQAQSFFSPAQAAPAGASAKNATKSDEANQATALPGFSMDNLRQLAESIQRTGVGVDSIAALYRPKFVNVSDASLSMDDDEVVFIVTYPSGHTRVYPQRIMVWHEVVNDTLPDASGNLPPRPVPGVPETAGESYTITYSPLSGTVTAFKSLSGSYPTTFGVTGDLLNANTILYDRISVSLWSQLLAVCLEGPMRGKRLERIPVLWARWGGVKDRLSGKAEVLSRSTGFRRSYGKDPYGSYHTKGNYYDSATIIHSISFLDRRLPPKKRILGLEMEELYGALQVDSVKEEKVLNFSMGLTPLVALYDEQMDAVRVFDRRLEGRQDQLLNFVIFEDRLVDKETRSEWNAEGFSTYGRHREKKLTPVFTIDAMWFSWAAFHRGSLIFPGGQQW